MEFGSSHVYAGTTDPNPYYSPVTIESKTDPSHVSTSPNEQNQEPLYEAVTEMYQTSATQDHIYDPVYIGSKTDNNPQYDQVPFKRPASYASAKPEYDEVFIEPIANAANPSTVNAIPTQSFNKPHPLKKSLSAAVIHKALKVTQKMNKKMKSSKSDSADLAPTPLSPDKSKSAVDKPLPPTPYVPPMLSGAPELPAPRRPPKPQSYQSMKVSKLGPIPSLPSPSNIALKKSSQPPTPTGDIYCEPQAPLTPTPVHMGYKPVYPTLSNDYFDGDGVPDCFDRPSVIASAPSLPTPVMGNNDFDLISFDSPMHLNSQPADSFPKRVQKRNLPSAPAHSASMIKRDKGDESNPKNMYATADTNVVSVKLGIVEQSNNSMVWAVPPVKCKKCQAVLLHHALSQNKNPGVCSFCQNQNSDVVMEVLPLVGKESDVTYLMGQQPTSTVDDPIIVFCVDTSGSMCVTSEMESSNVCFMSRLQGVKEGIQNQIYLLKQKQPKARVAIVTFNNMVTLLGDGSPEQYIAMTDVQLFDTDFIKTVGRSALMPGCLEQTYNQLAKTVNMLKEHGGTALGPALLLSVALASQKCGSQVIVCTDGRANVGIGSLESEVDYKMCHNFYKEASAYATEIGTMVSILSIEGTDCRLVELGKVADRSAGKVKIVNSANLTDAFSDIISNTLMATKVSVNIVTQKELYFNDADKNCQSLVKSFVGNATKDTEVTFKYGIQDIQSSPDNAMFQLQIRYQLPNGCTYLRVITQARPVTENQMLAEEGLNPTVVGTYASQLASKLVLDGELRDAKLTTEAHKSLISRALSIRSNYSTVSRNNNNEEDDRIYGSVCYQMEAISDEIKKVSDSVAPSPETKPSAEPPPLPARQYEHVEFPKTDMSILSLSLPDVPDSPLMRKEKIIEAVENCPDEVASKLFQYRNACGKMFTAM